jgi:hypothetical protein
MSLTKVTYSMIQGAPVNVLDYGADNTGATSASSAIQSAIDAAAGRPILVPPGTYKLTTGLTYDTTGDGIVSGLKIIGYGRSLTIFDNQTGGDAIIVTSGNDVLDWQENVLLSQFSITNSLSTAGTRGIKFIGVRGGMIDNVNISDQASHGIWLYSEVTDGSNIHIDIVQCDITGCGATGVYCEGVTAGVNALVNIKQCRIISNSTGIAWESMQNGTIENCAIAQNTSTGLVIDSGASYSKNCIVRNNEFDSNGSTQQVYIDAAENIELVDNYFVMNVGALATYQINVSSSAFYITMQRNMPRVPGGMTGITMYLVGASASYVQILNTDWTAWSSTGNTKFNVTNTTSIILDDNKVLRPAARNIINVTSTPDGYQPDTNAGCIFRLTIDTASARSIGVPLYPRDGQVITIVITNGTAGAITVTLNSIYQQASFTAPAAFKTITAQYYYDALALKWRCIGNWSNDM